MWKKLDSFFCFVVSHLPDSAKKKKPEVEISGSVLVDVNDQLCTWSYGSVDL